jgi:hypothetical protein
MNKKELIEKIKENIEGCERRLKFPVMYSATSYEGQLLAYKNCLEWIEKLDEEKTHKRL